MRTISILIAGVLVICVVTAPRAAPLDCTSTRLDAMQLAKCFPGSFNGQPRPPKVAPNDGQDRDLSEPTPRWSHQKGRLTYGYPESDVTSIIISCRGGMANVDIMVRPPQGKAGDKTPIKFKNGATEIQHVATLTELDGLSGDNVEFSIPTSDKLFDLLMRNGPVVAQVPGASLTLPSANGRATAVAGFRKSCVFS